MDVRLLDVPMDGRPWRVEWVGELQRRESVTHDFEVQVAFRRMRKTGDTYVPTLAIEICLVNTSELCGLPLGSMWLDGHLIDAPPFNEFVVNVKLLGPDVRSKSLVRQLQSWTEYWGSSGAKARSWFR